MIMKFDLACALWHLGLLEPEALPEVAQGGLGEGNDSPQLRIVAALSSSEAMHQGQMYFAGALRELGRVTDSRAEAARLCARIVSQEILGNRMDAMVGARMLWDVSLSVDDPQFHELDPFIYAASEYEERPNEKALFEIGVRREATRFAA
jgi:hypothetical protein